MIKFTAELDENGCWTIYDASGGVAILKKELGNNREWVLIVEVD